MNYIEENKSDPGSNQDYRMYELPILLYHRVVMSRREGGKQNIYVTVKQLRKQFEYLRNNDYKTITFKELKNINPITIESGNLYKKIILTFDDGYEDNYNLLFPLLKEFGFTAVIFLVTGFSKNEWDIKNGEKSFPLLNNSQIKEMDDYGIEFGGHTQNHVDLLKTLPDIQFNEINGCKKDIEKIIEKPVISFSYPFGAISNNIKEKTKMAGYRYGISTNTGPRKINDDLFQIRRIEISKNTTLFSFKRKVSGFYFSKKSFLDIFFSKKNLPA